MLPPVFDAVHQEKGGAGKRGWGGLVGAAASRQAGGEQRPPFGRRESEQVSERKRARAAGNSQERTNHTTTRHTTQTHTPAAAFN